MRDYSDKMRDYVDWVKEDKYLHQWFILGVAVFTLSLLIALIIGVNIPKESLVIQDAISNNTTHALLNNSFVQGVMVLLIIAIVLNNYLLCIVSIYALPWVKSKHLKRALATILIPYQGFISGIALAPFMLKWGSIMTLAIIIPHGIFEIPALVLAFSTGMAVLHKEPEQRKSLQKGSLIFSLILLTVASIVEVAFSPIFAGFIYQLILV